MSFERRRGGLPPVAYIMSRFPLLTETFILREMLGLQSAGIGVRIFPLLKIEATVRHAETEQLMGQVTYTPFLSREIIAANLHFLRRKPTRYLRTLWSALSGTFGSSNLFMGALGIFPKSVYFARLVEEEGIRHVHAHYATHPALSALIVAELADVTFSFTAHAHDIFVHRRMLKEKVEKAHFVVAISEFNKEYLLRLATSVAAEKIKVVHCGIELERYDGTEAPPSHTMEASRLDAGEEARDEHDEHDERDEYDEQDEHDERSRRLNILCVASLQHYKGIRYLIEACARLVERRAPAFRCLIVGEGVERTQLESLIERLRLGGLVHLLGARPQHEVAALLAASDLFVLPSVVAPDGQMEGIPVALMEAMASRLPVVATRLSGIPELVEDGTNGYLVPPADAQALAGAINSLFESEELRRRMGERGREKVAAEFSLRENVAKLSALFQATNEREGEEIRVMNEREGEEIRTAARAVPSREDDGLDADLRSQLARRAARFFSENKTNGDEKGGEAKVSFTRRGGGHDSEVYEVALAADGSLSRRAILKLHRPGRAADGEAVEQGRRFASQEHAALEFLWGEFTRRSARLSVPKPLDFLPEQAALVMEKCAGERLDVSLRWARLRRDERARARLLEQLNKCGEWLALFHQVTERTDAPAEVYGRIERDFHEELRACREVGLEASLASRIARRYERDKATVFDGRHRVVGRHCDFAPYNVIVADDRLAVIDFEGLQQGILYDDLCYFLGMVETMPFYHLGARLALRFRQSFLDGYAHGRGETNREHLEFFMLTTMVKIMAYSPVLRPRARGWRESLQRWQRLKFFKGWFRQRVS